jgi:hypothetical protein
MADSLFKNPIVSTLLVGAKPAMDIMGGMQQSTLLKTQAQQAELQARQEELKGREQADKIRRSLQATLATQNAVFASRGISTRSGTPVTLGNVSRNEASQDIETAQFNSGQSAFAKRSEAAQLRSSASAAKMAGFGKAFGTLLEVAR